MKKSSSNGTGHASGATANGSARLSPDDVDKALRTRSRRSAEPAPAANPPGPSSKPSTNDGAASAPAPASDRGPGGKFGPGNRAGKQFTPGNNLAVGRGNPFYRRVSALRRTILDVLTEERLAALIEAMYKRALAGDAAATKVLLTFAIGKPGPAPEPDKENLDELALLQARPTLPSVMAGQTPYFVNVAAAVDALASKAGATAEDVQAQIHQISDFGPQGALDLVKQTAELLSPRGRPKRA